MTVELRTMSAVQEIGRLRWRCRRGMKELDMLLTRYVDTAYADASAADQATFRELLEAQDTDIYAYFLGRVPPPTAAMTALIGKLLDQRAQGPL